MNRIRLLIAVGVAMLALPASAHAELVFPDGNPVREATSDRGAVVTWADPVVDADNVREVEGPTCSPESGRRFSEGNHTIDCAAVATICPPLQVCSRLLLRGSFKLTVTPQRGPAFGDLPDVEALTDAGRDTATVNYALPVPTDVSGLAPGSPNCAPAPGSAFPVGRSAVTCQADDVLGNRSTATFEVVVSRRAAAPPRVAPPASPRPPAPGSPRGPVSPDATPQPAGTRPVAIRRLRATRGSARVTLVCPSGNASPCAGTLRLETRGRSRKLRLGRKRFALKPRQRRTVRVRIGRSAQRRLARRPFARRGRVRLRAIATTTDQAGRPLTASRTFKVKAPRR